MAESVRISNGGKWKNYDYFQWDKTIPAKEYFKEMMRVSKNQIIFGGNYFDLPKHTTWIIWNKIQRGFMTDGEMAWTSFDKSIQIFDMSRVDAYINKDDRKVHPTQKPTALGRWILKNFATKDMKIFDPFAGSGSFLLACKQLGFDFVGCEINPEYIKMINSRLNQMSVSDFWSNDTHNRNLTEDFAKSSQINPTD